MANYQNNMRYGRQGNMRQSYPRSGMNAGYGTQSRAVPSRETRCDDSESIPGMQRGNCGCSTPAQQSDQGCRMADENNERRGRRSSGDCGCQKEDALYGMPIAMAYVPWQRWGDTYDLCDGFQTGTVFKVLNKPFLGRGGWKR